MTQMSTQRTMMTSQDFKDTVSEYMDIVVDHLCQVAKDENLPTSETDMLKIVEYIVRMKIEGVE